MSSFVAGDDKWDGIVRNCNKVGGYLRTYVEEWMDGSRAGLGADDSAGCLELGCGLVLRDGKLRPRVTSATLAGSWRSLRCWDTDC